MECEFCGKICKNSNSLSNHKVRCDLNPNKIITIWDESMRQKQSDIMKLKHNNSNRVWSKNTLKKLSEKSKNFNEKYWTEEVRDSHSQLMKKIVSENPKSYSTNNVCGRTKSVDYNGFKLNGSWELEVAKWLDSNNIKWTNEVNGFEYEWKGKRLYYPDFYLPDLDLYIEVKGFERERDRIKWKSIPNLIIIKEKEIKKIKENNFHII